MRCWNTTTAATAACRPRGTRAPINDRLASRARPVCRFLSIKRFSRSAFGMTNGWTRPTPIPPNSSAASASSAGSIALSAIPARPFITSIASAGSWRPGERITIIDFATGSADVPLAVLRWARRRRFDVRIVGVDMHNATARFAAAEIAASQKSLGRLRIVQADVLDLPFADHSFRLRALLDVPAPSQRRPGRRRPLGHEPHRPPRHHRRRSSARAPSVHTGFI